MSSKVTINISDETLQHITDPTIFRAKTEITEQLYQVFPTLIEDLQAQSSFQKFPFPEGTDTRVGKISRGEHYRQQPYVVCDFPRFFRKENIFAYRVMFWWGHYFIFTLHLGGESLQAYWPALSNNFDVLRNKDIWVSTGANEWEHAVEHEYFIPLDEICRERLKSKSAEAGFLKIAQTMPLIEYKSMPSKALQFFNTIIPLLH